MTFLMIRMCRILGVAALIAVGSVSSQAQTSSLKNLDSLFEDRVELNHSEEGNLFRFLTTNRFPNRNEPNEFKRARQIAESDSILSLLKDMGDWRTRYKIRMPNSGISVDPDERAWCHLGKYNFTKEAFEIKFGNMPFAEKQNVEEEVLRAYVRNRIPKSARIVGAYMPLYLVGSQFNKQYWLPLSSDSAENFKRLVGENQVTCEVVVDFLGRGDESIGLEPTLGYVNFRESQRRNLRNLSQADMEKSVLQSFQSRFPDNVSHEAHLLFRIPYKIIAVRFLDRSEKNLLVEWAPH